MPDNPWVWDTSAGHTSLSRIVNTETGEIRYMCVLCFQHFPPDKLNVLPSGDIEDVCKECAVEEQQLIQKRLDEFECCKLEGSRVICMDDDWHRNERRRLNHRDKETGDGSSGERGAVEGLDGSQGTD